MENSISHIIPGYTMPKAHDGHVDQISHSRGNVSVFKDLIAHQDHDYSHKDEVTEPEGQTHVPTIPKFL